MITILPSEISNQIAAGEVVERPASVVKELVENSIDAGAKNIEIHVEDGGKTRLEIRDDGSGMSPTDADKCIKRHATSKIKTIDDLFSVQSFGFRGEALAAISSVSNFELLTKREEDKSGTKIKIDGGRNKTISQAPSNTGTTIKISDLFWPTPARLAHLKNNQTEFGHIYKEIISFALSYPSIGFKVFKDNKLYKHVPSINHKKEMEAAALEAEMKKSRYLQVLDTKAEDLIFFNQKIGSTTISGCLIKPGLCLRSKKKQFQFVNNRRIEDFRLAYAVREAYVQSAGIEKHLQPLFVLKIHTDPILVDVNVHPRKLEVKFAEPYEMYQNVKGVCIQALQKNLNDSGNFSTTTPYNRSETETYNQNQKNSAPRQNYGAPQRNANQAFHQNLNFGALSQNRDQTAGYPSSCTSESVLTNSSNNFEQNSHDLPSNATFKDLEDTQTLKLVGQVANKYIMAEDTDGLWMFDQHALHERQRFEIFWAAYQEQKKNRQIAQQNTLIPVEIKLDIESVERFHQHKELLKTIGFVYELKDDETLLLKSVPQLLAKEGLGETFASLSEYLETEKIGEHVLDSFMRKRLEYKSCRGAVMFGDPLERVEMQQLLDDFLTTKWRNLCPHGRPNHWFIPFGELDQRFHR
jgi:DNA mismatch repair protein MutL